MERPAEDSRHDDEGGEPEESEEPREEGKRFPWEDDPDEEKEPGIVKRNLDELGEEAAEDVRTLHEGSSIRLLGTDFPVRLIGAISVFVGVFVVVYLLTWAALGDIGLAVGLFIAAILAIIAVKLFTSLSSASTAG